VDLQIKVYKQLDKAVFSFHPLLSKSWEKKKTEKFPAKFKVTLLYFATEF